MLSHKDYCNSLQAQSAQYQLDKLQCIQNMSCQVICNLRIYDQVSQAMRSLHWLKICESITYKLYLLVYKCHKNLEPKCLSDLLPSRVIVRSLGSSKSDNIQKAYFKNSQCQQSSFSSAGPAAWNSLPAMVKVAQSLGSFKSLLKHTYSIFFMISAFYYILFYS